MALDVIWLFLMGLILISIILVAIFSTSSGVSKLVEERLDVTPIVSDSGWNLEIRYLNYRKPYIVVCPRQKGSWEDNLKEVEVTLDVYRVEDRYHIYHIMRQTYILKHPSKYSRY